MEISALASGSSGNCFFISNKNNAILIDAGISTKKILERIKVIGKSPEIIKAIFITHEHTDHICGADVLARHFQIPIFATPKTIKNSFLCQDDSLIIPIKQNQNKKIYSFLISAFSKSHSAIEPISYTITANKRVSVITDAGYACKNIKKAVKNSDALFFESNHDVNLLQNGPYTHYLKKWILSDEGHLSNTQAALCILEHASPKLKTIILSHLSQVNNTPELALKTFQNLLKERKDIFPEILVSTRFEPTPLMTI